MEIRFLLRNLVFFFVLAVLSIPLLSILYQVPKMSFQYDPSLGWVIKGALLQALTSTLFTLVFGFLGALGLLSLKNKSSQKLIKSLSWIAILPSFLPVIMVVLLASQILMFLPTGLTGVVFFHTLMNTGLVSVFFESLILKTASDWYKIALVSGVDNKKFIFMGLIPELKSQWMGLGFYLMVLYFFSFSVPLLVGGTAYGGVEVYLFEKILFSGDWSSMIPYMLGLSLILFISSSLISQNPAVEVEKRGEYGFISYLGYRPLLLFCFGPSLLLGLALLQNIFSNLSSLNLLSILEPLRVSLIIGLLTGFLTLILLSLMGFAFITHRQSRILLSWVNPGWVVVGFSLLLIPGEGFVFGVFKISFGLTILFFPYLYRLSMDQEIKGYGSQVSLAQTFPVSWSKIFFRILWPQMMPKICLLSSIAGLWALGDFALSEILLSSSHQTSLGLKMKLLMTSYQLNSAMNLVLPLLFASIFVFLVFQGFSYVCRRKISS